MSELQLRLVERARADYGSIFPCSDRADLGQCFSEDGRRVIFWFNTVDNSTHIEMEDKVWHAAARDCLSPLSC